jgi:ATP-dependent DNA ligase
MTWYADYRPAGIEGLVIKSASGRYRAGRGDWIKVKNRQSVEVIVGAVTGSIDRPSAVIGGVLRAGDLVVVGRTAELTRAQADELAAALTPAGGEHPWPDEIGTGVFGTHQRVTLTKVERCWCLRSRPTRLCKAAATGIHCGTCACGST